MQSVPKTTTVTTYNSNNACAVASIATFTHSPNADGSYRIAYDRKGGDNLMLTSAELNVSASGAPLSAATRLFDRHSGELAHTQTFDYASLAFTGAQRPSSGSLSLSSMNHSTNRVHDMTFAFDNEGPLKADVMHKDADTGEPLGKTSLDFSDATYVAGILKGGTISTQSTHADGSKRSHASSRFAPSGLLEWRRVESYDADENLKSTSTFNYSRATFDAQRKVDAGEIELRNENADGSLRSIVIIHMEDGQQAGMTVRRPDGSETRVPKARLRRRAPRGRRGSGAAAAGSRAGSSASAAPAPVQGSVPAEGEADDGDEGGVESEERFLSKTTAQTVARDDGTVERETNLRFSLFTKRLKHGASTYYKPDGKTSTIVKSYDFSRLVTRGETACGSVGVETKLQDGTRVASSVIEY